MSILVDASTRAICQGLTGRQGRFHAEQCLDYGTRILAGVTPGRGGQECLGLPVFDTAEEAVRATGADTSLVFVPAPAAADAIMAAADAGIRLIVCITEGVPVLDMVRIKAALKSFDCRLIGPNWPGRDHAGAVQAGHHARLHPRARPHRHYFPLGNTDLRGGAPDHRARPGTDELRRHRRRPRAWIEFH